jgi:hypothetical protein
LTDSKAAAVAARARVDRLWSATEPVWHAIDLALDEGARRRRSRQVSSEWTRLAKRKHGAGRRLSRPREKPWVSRA